MIKEYRKHRTGSKYEIHSPNRARIANLIRTGQYDLLSDKESIRTIARFQDFGYSENLRFYRRGYSTRAFKRIALGWIGKPYNDLMSYAVKISINYTHRKALIDLIEYLYGVGHHINYPQFERFYVDTDGICRKK
jgi:hypothetical protein